MKFQTRILISCVCSLPLGYLIGKAIAPTPQVTLSQSDSTRSRSTTNSTPSPQISFEENSDSTPVRFPLSELPQEPSERLTALESHHFDLPAYALTRLIPETIGTDNKISNSMASLMELSESERNQFDTLLTTTVDSLRQIEASTYKVNKDRLGQAYVSVPAFQEKGANLRKQLLDQIEEKLGPSRRHLFEMQLLQAPTPLGEFGKQPMVLRYPESIEQSDQAMVTVQIGSMTDIGTKDERFQGREFQFTPDAFRQRFSHLLTDR